MSVDRNYKEVYTESSFKQCTSTYTNLDGVSPEIESIVAPLAEKYSFISKKS